MYQVDEYPQPLPLWDSQAWTVEVQDRLACTYITNKAPHTWIVVEPGDVTIWVDVPGTYTGAKNTDLTTLPVHIVERLSVMLLLEVGASGGPYIPGVGYRRNKELLIIHGGE
jgi:hypothetical protein